MQSRDRVDEDRDGADVAVDPTLCYEVEARNPFDSNPIVRPRLADAGPKSQLDYLSPITKTPTGLE